MKSALSASAETFLLSDLPNPYPTDRPGHRLETLRTTLDTRLAALEAALADPDKVDNLAGLILELAHVATEEAQEAANQTCAEALLEAEIRIAEARGAVQAEIDGEYAATAELRRALDQARRQVIENQDQMALARSVFEGELAAARTERSGLEDAVVRLEESLSDTARQLEVQIGANDDLRRAHADMDARWSAALTEIGSRLQRALRERDQLAETLGSTTGTPPLPPDQIDDEAPAPDPNDDEIDWVELRLSPRYSFPDPITIDVNGTAGELCDLSVGGCQLLCTTALRPNHTVKIVVPTDPEPLVCLGRTIWARLETPSRGTTSWYRAGIEFAGADVEGIEAFILMGGGVIRERDRR